jgi:hypothetical protein
MSATKITKGNVNRAKMIQREVSRASDRALDQHEYLERIDSTLALELLAAIDQLRATERAIGHAISTYEDERDAGATLQPETLDWHLSPETGTFVKTEGR